MEDPPNHSPAVDIDAISFGEISSDDENMDDYPSRPIHHDEEAKFEADSFDRSEGPTMDNDGFEFVEADDLPPYENIFPGAPRFNAESGSVHTMNSEEEQPSTEQPPFEQSTRPSASRHAQNRQESAQALGILYCDVCNKYFGNERVFKRHFMFQTKHGEESRDMRDLYYRVWAKTWADEARNMDRIAEDRDDMEL